jgi:hypothetical protein
VWGTTIPKRRLLLLCCTLLPQIVQLLRLKTDAFAIIGDDLGQFTRGALPTISKTKKKR